MFPSQTNLRNDFLALSNFHTHAMLCIIETREFCILVPSTSHGFVRRFQLSCCDTRSRTGPCLLTNESAAAGHCLQQVDGSIITENCPCSTEQLLTSAIPSASKFMLIPAKKLASKFRHNSTSADLKRHLPQHILH